MNDKEAADLIVDALVSKLRPGARRAVLDRMTPRQREEIEAARSDNRERIARTNGDPH